ncbi:hypothetical protein D3C73_976350 [compost metagenome]
MRRDPAAERDEQQWQADHHRQQRKAGQCHMPRIAGLQHDEQRRQGQQFTGNGLAGDPEPLVLAQPQPRQRIHDEAGGRGQQRQRQQPCGLPWQTGVTPGQPADAEQGRTADQQMRQQRPHAAPQGLQVHFQPGKQEQRRNAQRGQQSDDRVVRLVAQPEHADDAEQQAGQGRGQAEPLQRARDHQQREDQQQVDQFMTHRRLPCGSKARRMRVRAPWGKPPMKNPLPQPINWSAIRPTCASTAARCSSSTEAPCR